MIAIIVFVGGATLVAAEKTKLIGGIESSPQAVPLQLLVATQGGNRLIQCSEKTSVMRGKKKADRDTLRKGQYLAASGTVSGDLFLASEIELVDAIDGKIEAIMEIFPLRLSVKTKTGVVTVQLKKETRVLRGKDESEAGKLRNGDTVRVIGNLTDDRLDAQEISVTVKNESAH